MKKWLSLLLFLLVLAGVALPAEAAYELRLNVPEYKLRLFDGSRLLKEYSVAVGTPYEQTPVGQFSVFYKEKYPTWHPGSGFVDKTPVPPGPANPLGTRWMEFSRSYGIHGTNKDWSIEYPVSGGCVRMYNRDVEELFDKISLGTPVIVTYETMSLTEKADGLYLTIFPDIYEKRSSTWQAFLALYQPYAGEYLLLRKPEFAAAQETVWTGKVAVRKQALRMGL
ncbi:L,D-transpeptidase [Anaeromusa acidaminophila]|uniref:L,D-transpeptidase n=1 Tax=Anaeromusa acidaminophila TaxID=81464 RepID=UPI0003780D09|nr:L,D-transpeptidase [Anaeromusa acidaminophila]